MHKFSAVMCVALLGGVLFGLPPSLSAQKAPSGGGTMASALFPADEFGGGNLLGVGGKVEFGLTSKLSVGGALRYYWDGETEVGELRDYSLWAPTADLRFSFLGDANEYDLAFLLSPGLLIFNSQPIDPAGNVIGESKTDLAPVLGPGLGTRLKLFNSVYAEIEARDWMTWAEGNTLGTLQGSNSSFTQSPELRVGFSVLFGPETTNLEERHRVPLNTQTNFQPVPGNQVRLDPIHHTAGRKHTHTPEGQTLELMVQDTVNTRGRSVPPVQINGPASPMEADTLGVINFGAGSAEIQEKYHDLIRQTAQKLQQQPQSRLKLRAYTDAAGGVLGHISLAERRGTNIKQRLVRLFDINNNRIEVVAIGADEQAASAEKARRVEVVLEKAEGQ